MVICLFADSLVSYVIYQWLMSDRLQNLSIVGKYQHIITHTYHENPEIWEIHLAFTLVMFISFIKSI